ncbi:hypothetical protein LFM09_05395 [Lentzea alba]|uniref:hypothetical protein n=1 Tax=Lentzea alba TaxID=2714351 RepID=UPI0039BF0A93
MAALAVIGTALALAPIASAQSTRTDPFLDKAEYGPGETINIHLARGYKCGTYGGATSDGFTAPAELTQGGPDNWPLTGKTTAVDKPGSYEAIIKCLTGSVVNKFTIKVPPTTTTTPPAPTPPGRKPPIVKPKGAPDTGGGGTASR